MTTNVDLNLHPKMYGVTRALVKQILLRALQTYFSVPNCKYVWEVNSEDPQIYITDEHLSVGQTNVIPAIMVIFTGSRPIKSFLNDNVSLQYIEDTELGTGTPKYIRYPNGVPVPSMVKTDMVQGSVAIICRDRGWSAVWLAEQVENFITVYADALREMGFADIKSVSMSKERRVTEDTVTTMTEVEVNIEFHIQRRWAILKTDFECLNKNIIGNIDGEISAWCINPDADDEVAATINVSY